MEGWREVTKEEFYSVIGPQNVHPRVEGKFPYTSTFVTQSGYERGKAIDYIQVGRAIIETRYLLPNAGAKPTAEAEGRSGSA